MRLPLIVGNWKMNTTVTEAVNLVKSMQPELGGNNNLELVLCPPFISLIPVYELIKDSQVQLGAQNMHFAEKGAYTGEISPLMLTDICQYVIIGHSERRQYFGENGDLINKKVAAALKTGLKPILCVGERLEENESGKTNEVIKRQLDEALKAINNIDSLVIAYEPVWAIGTGRPATGKQANETAGYIRYIIKDIYGADTAGRMRILYGGSVTAANAAEFMSETEIDGALVGGASLKASEFISIVRQTSELKK